MHIYSISLVYGRQNGENSNNKNPRKKREKRNRASQNHYQCNITIKCNQYYFEHMILGHKYNFFLSTLVECATKCCSVDGKGGKTLAKAGVSPYIHNVTLLTCKEEHTNSVDGLLSASHMSHKRYIFLIGLVAVKSIINDLHSIRIHQTPPII